MLESNLCFLQNLGKSPTSSICSVGGKQVIFWLSFMSGQVFGLFNKFCKYSIMVHELTKSHTLNSVGKIMTLHFVFDYVLHMSPKNSVDQ